MARFEQKSSPKSIPPTQRFEPQSTLVRFYRLIPGMRQPERADQAAAGTMPARAFRLCEAMRSASAFGWYLYPPIGFTVMWDGGSEMVWTYAGAEAWHAVTTTHFPGFPSHFDRMAPVDLKPFVPPFLAAFKEPGILQIWTGVIARTASGWSLLVRSPANLVHSKAYDFLEGIIKTDSWFGPLFTTIRLTRINAPIEFSPEVPFLQVQPVHRAQCYDKLDNYQVVPNMSGLTQDDWGAFRNTLIQPAATSKRQAKRSAASRQQPANRAVRFGGTVTRSGTGASSASDA